MEALPRAAASRTEYLPYINSLRGVAILFIIVMHGALLFDWHEPPEVSVRAMRWLLGNATVMFVFISGFLFQHLSSRFIYRRYLKIKLERVMLPYAIISIPALLHPLIFS